MIMNIFSYFDSKHKLQLFVGTDEMVQTGTNDLCLLAKIREVKYTPFKPTFHFRKSVFPGRSLQGFVNVMQYFNLCQCVSKHERVMYEKAFGI